MDGGNALNQQEMIVPAETIKKQAQQSLELPTSQTTTSGNKTYSSSSFHPIHPSNLFLFPQLDGIWQHYQRFRVKKMTVVANPTCALTSPGNFSVTTLAPEDLN